MTKLRSIKLGVRGELVERRADGSLLLTSPDKGMLSQNSVLGARVTEIEELYSREPSRRVLIAKLRS